MPWPEESSAATSRVVTIGREPDNDVVIDLPIVSGHHARVVWEGGSAPPFLEDLNSANGTAIGGPELKIKRAMLTALDTVFLGSHAVPASIFLRKLDPALVPSLEVGGDRPPASRPEPVKAPSDSISIPSDPAPLVTPPIVETGAAIGRSLGPIWPLAILPAQAMAIGLGIVFGARLGVGKGFISGLSWLGLAAIWSGLSGALMGRSASPSGWISGRFAPIAVAAALALSQALILWLVGSIGLNLSAPALPTMGFLIVASGVGLAIGLTIVSIAPRPAIAWPIVGILALVLWAFGGERWPSPQIPAPARLASDALPSRWAFEGLLLLESARRSPAEDLAEPFFPAESARMGVNADATALVAMFLGWSALAAFIASARRPARGAA